jgi:surface-anchored protein
MQYSLSKTTVRAALLGGALLTTFSTAAATDWTEGHGDIAVNHVAGEWRFGVVIDSFPGTEFAPHEVLIKAGNNARLAIPASPNFSFLGAAGDPVWIYPQSQAAGVPFVGISAEATPLGTFVNNRFNLELSSVAGPGHFFMWTTSGTGTPTVRMNSADGISAADVFNVPSGGHAHMNWGFSSPGTYSVGVKGVGTLAGQPTPATSKEAVYTFEVSVIKDGEVDLEVAYHDGELEFHLHHETTDTEFEPAHVALQAGPATWTTVPADAAFGFLGPGGEHLYVLPQDEQAGVLFLGLAAGEVPAGTFVNDELTVQLTAVTGPGAVFYYEVDGFGAPTVFFNSADGLTTDDAVAVAAGSHAHRNWAFSAPGVYRVTLVAAGELTGGGTVTSEPATFLFEVLPPRFFDRGEIDLEVVFQDGAFELELLDEAAGREYAAHEAVLVARPPARAQVPAEAALAFLGHPGATVYILPQDETEGLLFPGLAADEITPGLFVGETVNLRLASLAGPGHLALYETGAFGVPTVFWNSADGLTTADVFPAAVGSHAHLNWAFTAPGVYRVGLQATGTLVAGNQAVASGVVIFSFEIKAPVVFADGEIDFEIVYADGTWELVLLDEANNREFETDEVLLVTRPAAKQSVPNDPAFAFLGTAGSAMHILPQDETAGLLFPGIAADEIAPGVFQGEVVNLLLTAVAGPGEFALYEVDAFGAPTAYMNTRDGLGAADSYPVPVGAHAHLNWAFSAPGEYRLTFKAAGTLAQGGQPVESGEVTLTFIVQDTGPALTAATVNGGGTLRIGWNSRAGASYQLQSRTSLTAGAWGNQGEPIAGDGTPKGVDAAITTDPLKVFQVIEVQP